MDIVFGMYLLWVLTAFFVHPFVKYWLNRCLQDCEDIQMRLIYSAYDLLKLGGCRFSSLLQRCQGYVIDFAQRVQAGHQQDYQQSLVNETSSFTPMLVTVVVSMLSVTISVSSCAFGYSRSGPASINRIFTEVSPAVANIQVEPAGVVGTGIVFDKNGYVLTNYHVIKEARNDQDIIVVLPGMGQLRSTLLGHDVATDLAVLKVDAAPNRLTVADFGDANKIQVGDLVIAIGNPFRLSHSLTVGYISAVGRRLASNDPYAPDIEGVLQTDAAINPGNSGGPLLNSRGQVIGINTRIESPSGGSVGLGFAIPANTALHVAQEIIAHGYVRRPFLGAKGRLSS